MSKEGGGAVTVYLDLVFTLNFAVNYLLLRGTARLGASAAPRRRLAGGAAIGAAYAAAVYLPGCGFLTTPPVKLLVGAAMLLAAFGWQRSTLRLGAVFAALSLVLCGAVYAVELLKGGRVRYYRNSLLYPVTFGSLLLTAGAVCAACRLLLPRLTFAADSTVSMQLALDGRRVRLTAVRDSGNLLCDPMTGAPVVTAEWQSAARLLPQEQLTQKDFEAPAMLALRLKKYRPRLIPYHAVGVSDGMLLALPCSITVGRQTRQGLTAFSPTPISGGAYQALIGAEFTGATAGRLRKGRTLC